uniref:SRR1-like domain-containing protein n=1 Tax=Strigamia maritima TaxID=126957 RepID=T1IID1_STRMM
MDDEQFQVVGKKRRRYRQRLVNLRPAMDNSDGPFLQSVTVDVNRTVKKVADFRVEIMSSDFYLNCVQTLNKSLKLITNEKKNGEKDIENEVESLVCYGLGNFSQCSIACYQLALYLCLQELLKPTTAFVFDPVFLREECEILTSLGVVVIEHNEEGKRRVGGTRTLFYLPHCGKALYNNLLWANWGSMLNCLVVLGNSFSRVFETASKGVLRDRWPYLLRAVAHTQEFAVQNNFRFLDVFNDLSVHVFPVDKIKSYPNEYWGDCDEPTYDGNEIEIITNEMMKHFKTA